MNQIESLTEFNFLSELYEHDTPLARLLAEYPSSNSDETIFRNRSKYIIHDPFPPPRREILKVLGPHHLMCGWGRCLSVSSEVRPPRLLLDHWEKIFGKEGCPDWQPFNPEADYITLFPHELLAAARQVVAPDVSYAVHSKKMIEKINCPQAEVLNSVIPPCIVKLSHGYAGLGNFLIRDETDVAEMRQQLAMNWPDATLVTNSIIENITADFGVQFYLRRDGAMVWLGLTKQLFDENQRWCGGTFSADLQMKLFGDLCGMIEPVGMHLHTSGYFGLVGIDILRDTANRLFLIDVNPRLTGISPFLVASRIFAREGLTEGIYRTSRRFCGSYEELISTAEQTQNARVLVFSAVEEVTTGGDTTTICHLSVTSDAQERNQQILHKILQS